MMAAWESNLNLKGKLVKANINKLTLIKDDYKNLPLNSPSLRELQNGPSRVKILSKVFEEKSRAYNEKANWWLEKKFKSSLNQSPSPSPPRITLSKPESPAGLTTKLERIIFEMLQKEETFIQALEKGIDSYVNVIKSGNHEVPYELRHQVFRLFGNIEEIYELHKHSVYPRLTVCNGNARLIAETMSNFVQNDLFYCYIVYAMNQKLAEQLIGCHREFFENLRKNSYDLLGINSFTIQPIQKLPRYKMFFDEIIKELSRDMLTNKEAVAACCVAEKNMQRILNRMNEALSINDILETHEFSVSEQSRLMTSMQRDFGVSINEPMMILVPKTSSHFTFRSPFNVYELGKFCKCGTFKAWESYTGRSFPSKVFLFEKCILYTKIMSDKTFGYRNHFTFSAEFAFIINESQVSFRVAGFNRKSDVEFSSDNIESIAEMKKLIRRYYDPRRSGDSGFSLEKELVINENQYMSEDENDDDWIVTDEMDETMKIANSRFYVKSPEPESD